MMTLEELLTLLESTELPVVYNAWQEGAAPRLPYIVYRQTGVNVFPADNKTFFAPKDIDIELYTKTKDPTTEALVEGALDDVVWRKTEIYLDTERCYEILYEIEV